MAAHNFCLILHVIERRRRDPLIFRQAGLESDRDRRTDEVKRTKFSEKKIIEVEKEAEGGEDRRSSGSIRGVGSNDLQLEFVHDQMASGRWFRGLNVPRKCLAPLPDTSISG